jgi:DNA integrity scanning protein DisA with diadenylate cyclase activity
VISRRWRSLDRLVALVEQLGEQLGVAVDARDQLGEVVAADREAVETLGELSARKMFEGISHIM